MIELLLSPQPFSNFMQNTYFYKKTQINCNKNLLFFIFILFFISKSYAQERKQIQSFEAYTIDGKAVSINDFRGKVVYLDIWATWCLPCRILFPKSQKLEEQYSEENIEFIYISIDHEKAKWEKFIFNKQPKGIQLLASQNFLDQFMNHYSIIGIPRFMLIDKKGNLFSEDASLPNWPELIDEINLLLSE